MKYCVPLVLSLTGLIAAGEAAGQARGPATALPLLADSLAPAQIARGDSIFHGRLAGGICYTCHGADARGINGIAPNLTDTLWLNGSGSYSFIIELVSRGVPRPKQAIAPMQPMGGARLNAQQIRAVASYVLSLSRNLTPRSPPPQRRRASLSGAPMSR